jgi:hypothetical protein
VVAGGGHVWWLGMVVVVEMVDVQWGKKGQCVEESFGAREKCWGPG